MKHHKCFSIVNGLEFDMAFIIFFMFGTLIVLPSVEPDGSLVDTTLFVRIIMITKKNQIQELLLFKIGKKQRTPCILGVLSNNKADHI